MNTLTDMTLQDRITRILADRIVKGVLKPGEWLRQDAFASEFNISHVPVREAFRRLESQGLVLSEPRKGVKVVHLDEASIIEITKMRAALETLAMRVAVPLISENDIDNAIAAIEQASHATNIETWESCNRAFHEAVSRPCGMPRLLRAIDELHVARLRYMYATAGSTNWDPQSQREHRQILDAIRDRDVERACGLIEQHVLESAEVVVNALREQQKYQE
ncbi:MAG: GntR family transcriptional regulator [Burkholderia sp.]|jgi:DNA-binding GntR family transcriptional regulator|uniref:GntR family transcriptional regulator n=1 Tax=Burkholderia sp. TaxID=36773 RepID=UPI002829AE4D|nr:GntR family transcriptional regulator [Burkholderia sp.]MDR0242651.1 GntR family transcriptional regulator [Burkholderia sp.]